MVFLPPLFLVMLLPSKEVQKQAEMFPSCLESTTRTRCSSHGKHMLIKNAHGGKMISRLLSLREQTLLLHMSCRFPVECGFQVQKRQVICYNEYTPIRQDFWTKKNSFPPIDGSLVSLREISNQVNQVKVNTPLFYTCQNIQLIMFPVDNRRR